MRAGRESVLAAAVARTPRRLAARRPRPRLCRDQWRKLCPGSAYTIGYEWRTNAGLAPVNSADEFVERCIKG